MTWTSTALSRANMRVAFRSDTDAVGAGFHDVKTFVIAAKTRTGYSVAYNHNSQTYRFVWKED